MSNEILENFLKKNKDHFNTGKEYPDYHASLGSIKVDIKMGGGLGSGIHRFVGASEGGKTSEALVIAANALKNLPNCKLFFVKAEGRLSDKVKERSGIKWATNAQDWKAGTGFVLECNIFEPVADLLDKLITDNKSANKADRVTYIIIIDSLDGMVLKGDSEKKFEGEDRKVAGVPLLSKQLFARLSLPIHSEKHMMIVLSQKSAHIPQQYEVQDQLKLAASGGNAAIHFADYILTFMPKRGKSDYIVDGGKRGKDVKTDSEEFNIVGHFARIQIAKSENETTGMTIEYPVLRGKKGEPGRIWTELEVFEMLKTMRLIENKGSWYNYTESAKEILEGTKFEDDIDKKHQGAPKMFSFFSEGKGERLDFWYKYIVDLFLNDEIY